jgi:TetR/AcrR family transcriptional regulator, lmrAB and yxaGH operons repressor
LVAGALEEVLFERCESQFATESGLDAVDARLRAEEALIRIEGSLIFARTVGSGAVFERTLKFLPDLLSLT